ncbi:MAG: hypothetical protein ABL879_10745 [Devosia sp.]
MAESSKDKPRILPSDVGPRDGPRTFDVLTGTLEEHIGSRGDTGTMSRSDWVVAKRVAGQEAVDDYYRSESYLIDRDNGLSNDETREKEDNFRALGEEQFEIENPDPDGHQDQDAPETAPTPSENAAPPQSSTAPAPTGSEPSSASPPQADNSVPTTPPDPDDPEDKDLLDQLNTATPVDPGSVVDDTPWTAPLPKVSPDPIDPEAIEGAVWRPPQPKLGPDPVGPDSVGDNVGRFRAPLPTLTPDPVDPGMDPSNDPSGSSKLPTGYNPKG